MVERYERTVHQRIHNHTERYPTAILQLSDTLRKSALALGAFPRHDPVDLPNHVSIEGLLPVNNEYTVSVILPLCIYVQT